MSAFLSVRVLGVSVLRVSVLALFLSLCATALASRELCLVNAFREREVKIASRCRRRSRKVQRGGKDNVPPDLELALLHLRKQLRVADDASGISDLAARLVESSDRSNDRSLLDVGERSDLTESLCGGGT